MQLATAMNLLRIAPLQMQQFYTQIKFLDFFPS